jgi:hypothetical protein
MNGKQVLTIIIATFITLVIWVSADIIHSRSKVTIDPEVEKLLEPVKSTFDAEIIEQL